jgi:hypothetical protein
MVHGATTEWFSRPARKTPDDMGAGWAPAALSCRCLFSKEGERELPSLVGDELIVAGMCRLCETMSRGEETCKRHVKQEHFHCKPLLGGPTRH